MNGQRLCDGHRSVFVSTNKSDCFRLQTSNKLESTGLSADVHVVDLSSVRFRCDEPEPLLARPSFFKLFDRQQPASSYHLTSLHSLNNTNRYQVNSSRWYV